MLIVVNRYLNLSHNNGHFQSISTAIKYCYTFTYPNGFLLSWFFNDSSPDPVTVRRQAQHMVGWPDPGLQSQHFTGTFLTPWELRSHHHQMEAWCQNNLQIFLSSVLYNNVKCMTQGVKLTSWFRHYHHLISISKPVKRVNKISDWRLTHRNNQHSLALASVNAKRGNQFNGLCRW